MLGIVPRGRVRVKCGKLMGRKIESYRLSGSQSALFSFSALCARAQMSRAMIAGYIAGICIDLLALVINVTRPRSHRNTWFMREDRTFDIVCNSLAGVPNYTRFVSVLRCWRRDIKFFWVELEFELDHLWLTKREFEGKIVEKIIFLFWYLGYSSLILCLWIKIIYKRRKNSLV